MLKRLITVVVLTGILGVVVATSACQPIDTVSLTIAKAVNWIWYTPPDNTSIDCDTIIFDQSVNPYDFTTSWTFVHMPTPQLIPAKLTACFGAGRGGSPYSTRTYKASNNPNNYPNSKQAVCWVTSFTPVNLGQSIWRCSFTKRPDFNWVVNTLSSYDGYLAVGSPG